mgnify:CR=1 FL=1
MRILHSTSLFSLSTELSLAAGCRLITQMTILSYGTRGEKKRKRLEADGYSMIYINTLSPLSELHGQGAENFCWNNPVRIISLKFKVPHISGQDQNAANLFA